MSWLPPFSRGGAVRAASRAASSAAGRPASPAAHCGVPGARRAAGRRRGRDVKSRTCRSGDTGSRTVPSAHTSRSSAAATRDPVVCGLCRHPPCPVIPHVIPARHDIEHGFLPVMAHGRRPGRDRSSRRSHRPAVTGPVVMATLAKAAGMPSDGIAAAWHGVSSSRALRPSSAPARMTPSSVSSISLPGNRQDGASSVSVAAAGRPGSRVWPGRAVSGFGQSPALSRIAAPPRCSSSHGRPVSSGSWPAPVAEDLLRGH